MRRQLGRVETGEGTLGAVVDVAGVALQRWGVGRAGADGAWEWYPSTLGAIEVTVQRGPRQLVFADDPEQWGATGMNGGSGGLLFRDVVGGTLRVFAYGVNATGENLTVQVDAAAPSASVTIQRVGQFAGAGSAAAGGAQAAMAWWSSAQRQPMAISGSTPVWTANVPSGQLYNLIMDLSLSTAVTLTVGVHPPGTPMPTEPLPLPDVVHPVYRGLFAGCDITAAASGSGLYGALWLPLTDTQSEWVDSAYDVITAVPGYSALDGGSTVNGSPVAQPGYGFLQQLTIREPPVRGQWYFGPGVRNAATFSTAYVVDGTLQVTGQLSPGYAVPIGPVARQTTFAWLASGGIDFSAGLLSLPAVPGALPSWALPVGAGIAAGAAAGLGVVALRRRLRAARA